MILSNRPFPGTGVLLHVNSGSATDTSAQTNLETTSLGTGDALMLITSSEK